MPFYLAVSHSQEDPDDPGFLVPGCCVLTAMGLAPLAATAPGGLSRAGALRRALAALTASKSLVWGPGGLTLAAAAAEGGDGGGGGGAGAASCSRLLIAALSLCAWPAA